MKEADVTGFIVTLCIYLFSFYFRRHQFENNNGINPKALYLFWLTFLTGLLKKVKELAQMKILL